MRFQYEQLDHVQIAAPKGGEEQARKFYRDLLGFQEVDKPDKLKARGGAWFSNGQVHIHIGIEEPFQPARKAHPAIRVRNIEEMKQYLNSSNALYKVDHELSGANLFYMDDPFGNRIEFLEWE
ncbi:VOC family protein [Ornithinibacillus scapharcae]|uniref:VOC family protein n=1 Tax=Ornithinibacillus scapharcae TaxID=1147159 RepID=UPI000225AD57|nr:VOC family protein [Ornithinibacillus scapharcae]